jgi:hypothetical protein
MAGNIIRIRSGISEFFVPFILNAPIFYGYSLSDWPQTPKAGAMPDRQFRGETMFSDF